MKSGIHGRDLPGPYQLILLQRALITKTHGTDIPATETLAAPVELRLPILESSLQIHCFNARYFLTIGFFSLRTIDQTIRKGFFTFASPGQLIRTAYSNRDDLLFVQLFPFEEFFQSSLITTSNQNRKRL